MRRRLVVSLALVLPVAALVAGSLAVRRAHEEKPPPAAATRTAAPSAPPAPPKPLFTGEKMAPTPPTTQEKVAQGMNRTGVRQWIGDFASTYVTLGSEKALRIDLTFVARYGETAKAIFRERIAEEKSPEFRSALEFLLGRLERGELPKVVSGEEAEEERRAEVEEWLEGSANIYSDKGPEEARKTDLSVLRRYGATAKQVLREQIAKARNPGIRGGFEILLQRLEKE